MPQGPKDNRKFIFRREKMSSPIARKNKLVRSNDIFSTCQIKDDCSTCKYINLSYETMLTEKFQKSSANVKGNNSFNGVKFLPPVYSPKNLAYKTSTTIFVDKNRSKDSIEKFRIGYLGTRNYILEAGACPINVVGIGKLVRALKFHLNKSTLEPWDSQNKNGDLIAIDIKSSHITRELMVVFFVARPCKQALKQLISLLKTAEHKINSSHMQIIDPMEANVLKRIETATLIDEPRVLSTILNNGSFQPKTQRLSGTEKLRERICDLNIEISPESYFPANPWQAIHIYRRVEQIIGVSSQQHSCGWELNSSQGLLSMSLAKLGHNMISFDKQKTNINDAQTNGMRNELDKNLKFLQGTLSEHFLALHSEEKYPNFIIINSYTGGLDENEVRCLQKVLDSDNNTQIIYLTNREENLQVELPKLVKNKAAIRQIEAFDLEPQTERLFWLAIITPTNT